MTSHRCAILCVLPPHILERIVSSGSSGQRQMAMRALLQSERIRGQRDAVVPTPITTASPAGIRQRTIYDAQYDTLLPGKLVREELDLPTGDPAVDEAFDGAGKTYDLFYEIYRRNSLDDRGLPLTSTVHYNEGFDNAFWNGTQMVYGDGDENLPENERIFNRFTASLDIIGHELTHGVTQHEANLLYFKDPGAINESFSDIFGSMVKQRALNQTAGQADWLIGAELFTDRINADGVRSLKEPGTAYDDPLLGKDPQPGHMDNYVKLAVWTDNGGVHINSGIPNRAFCMTALELGGFAWEEAGRIWYYTLRDRLRRTSGFQELATRTHQVAGDLYGEGSREQVAVRNGWEAVGIDVKKFSLYTIGV